MQPDLKKNKLIVISITILCIGAIVGYLICRADNKVTHNRVTCDKKEYSLLDPIVVCESFTEKMQRVKDLEFEITKLITEKIEKKEIEGVSVFYRDLDSRRWFGINADESFYPASLLKLPEIIAYYKYAEAYPDILTRKVVIPEDQKDQNIGQYFKLQSSILPGKEYSIRKLLEEMIINSDNNTIQTLNKNIPSDFSYNAFRDIGLPEPVIYNEKSSWSITVRIYGSILRSLYLSSYLSPQSSEQILKHLTETKFQGGLRAVIPQNIPVAHKFGEAALLNPDRTIAMRVLHDCGIVYNKKDPYIICIMTKGMEMQKMTKTIQDIADIVQKRHNLHNPTVGKEDRTIHKDD